MSRLNADRKWRYYDHALQYELVRRLYRKQGRNDYWRRLYHWQERLQYFGWWIVRPWRANPLRNPVTGKIFEP